MSMFVICYDIPDNRRRNRVAAALEGFGVRVQKSVFECDLDTRRAAQLRAALQALVEPDEDKVRFYPLCAKDHALALAWDQTGMCRPQTLWLV